LRQFIRFFAQAKETIVSSPSLAIIVNMLTPANIQDIPAEFEIKIYQFLIQLVKEDHNKKAVVGKLIFYNVFQERLRLITAEGGGDESIALFSASKGMQNPHEIEYNFFKLMHFLTKNSPSNSKLVKDLKPILENYNEMIKAEGAVRAEIVKKIEAILKDAMF